MKTPATNEATLNITGGDLTFTAPEPVSFGSTTVTEVYNGKFTPAEQTGSTDVSDFLGDNGTWTMNVFASGWSNAKDPNSKDKPSKMEAGSTLTVKSDADTATFGKASNSTQPIANGGAGKSTHNLSFDLAIDSETTLSTGAYTNTLTWSLTNAPAADTAE